MGFPSFFQSFAALWTSIKSPRTFCSFSRVSPFSLCLVCQNSCSTSSKQTSDTMPPFLPSFGFPPPLGNPPVHRRLPPPRLPSPKFLGALFSFFYFLVNTRLFSFRNPHFINRQRSPRRLSEPSRRLAPPLSLLSPRYPFVVYIYFSGAFNGLDVGLPFLHF